MTDEPCQTCNDDPEVCALVPGLRHCEKANREATDPEDWYAKYRREVEAVHAKAVALLEWMRENTPEFDTDMGSNATWNARWRVLKAIETGRYDEWAPIERRYAGREIPENLLWSTP